MVHHMKLSPEPFLQISDGYKTIELRLYDEKRQCIKTGDMIVFSNTEDAENTILTKVVALHRFIDFDALYKVLPLDKCGYLPDQIPNASPEDMLAYYDLGKQKQYGVLGIELQLVDNN